MECGCMCVIMCCIGFMQRCIIFLNYLATSRWKLFGRSGFAGTWPNQTADYEFLKERLSGYTLLFFFCSIFLVCLLERIPASTCLAFSVMR